MIDPQPKPSTKRLDAIIKWLKEHERELAQVEKGSLVFNIGGDSIVPELNLKYEKVTATT